MNGELPSVQTNASLAPALWQDLFAGMTVEEIQQSRPEVIAGDGSNRLANGAVAELVIPSFDLNGESYLVQLYILNGTLSQVTLSLGEGADLNTAMRLLPLFRAKYGPELNLRMPEEESFLPKMEAEWIAANGVNIHIVCYEGLLLNINYQLRMAAELDKL